jgi:hypothetical protein
MERVSFKRLRRTCAFGLATSALIAAPTAHAGQSHIIPLVSEHGAGQVYALASQAIPLVSEHGAGQSGNASAAVKTLAAGQLTVDAKSDRFDWQAAGMGAAVTLGAVALLGATLVSTRHRRRLSGT